jgi:pilus assembly protein Flp/PilA
MDLKDIKHMAAAFAREEDGGQIVEYGLIIAVVSLGLILLLKPLVTGSSFSGFIGKVQNCLGGATTCT